MAKDEVDIAIEKTVDHLVSSQSRRFKPGGQLNEEEFLLEFTRTNALSFATDDVKELFDALAPVDRNARVLKALNPHR